MEELHADFKSILSKLKYPDLDTMMDNFEIDLLLDQENRPNLIAWFWNKINTFAELDCEVNDNDPKQIEKLVHNLVEYDLCSNLIEAKEFINCTLNKNKQVKLFKKIFYCVNTLEEARNIDYETGNENVYNVTHDEIVDNCAAMVEYYKKYKPSSPPVTNLDVTATEEEQDVKDLEIELLRLHKVYDDLNVDEKTEQIESISIEKIRKLNITLEATDLIDISQLPPIKEPIKITDKLRDDLIDLKEKLSALVQIHKGLQAIPQQEEEMKEFEEWDVAGILKDLEEINELESLLCENN